MRIRNTTVAFFGGTLVQGALYALITDCMGRERYAEFARTQWVPAWLSIPLALLMFAAGVQLLRKSEEESDG